MWMFASSRRSLCTRAFAWVTSAFKRSGSYFVDDAVDVVEFTAWKIVYFGARTKLLVWEFSKLSCML